MVAIGTDEQGRFKTSRHKEYPAQFCLALAFAFAQQFDRLVRAGQTRTESPAPVTSEQWVVQAAKASAVMQAGAQWLPDFQDL